MTQVVYRRKHHPRKTWVVGGLIGGLLLIISAITLLLYPFASKEKVAFFQGNHPILFNGRQAGNAIIDGDKVYVSLAFLQKNIDSHIRLDEKSNSIIITTKDKVVQMPSDSLTYFINDQPVSLPFSPIKNSDSKLYIAVEPLLSFYPIQYKILSDRNAIWILQNGDKYSDGIVKDQDINREKLRLRTEPTLRSPYTADVSKKEAVYIEGEKDHFYFVRKRNGMSGYIQKNYVKQGKVHKITITNEIRNYQLPNMKGPINLTWEAVYTRNPDVAKITEMPGLNVISPTWFSLGGEDGSIHNLASIDYSHWAKQRGYQVWGLFSNSFDPELTGKVFKDFDTRKNIIKRLLQYSQMYQLQGINFDIENVNPEDGPLVTQFIREAVPYLHEAGLVVSMDVTFSTGSSSNNWSSFYERAKLSDVVDYLVIMAYDEHTAANGPGSVASLPWVENNLRKLLQEVPEKKLILGVPLYARLWKEQTTANGGTELTSKALTMEQVKTWLAEKGIHPVYDEETGQNYAEYVATNENATYKIWIEDELSLKKRIDLSLKYKLAGVASWSRSFGDPTAWTALDISKMVVQK
ncbi:glycosyl hydrolase family 18 protein [Neobacillus sp. LXY-1]|uniref:glycosyl hydrolase family 18 protein n=1 Tax=Neobacillus sp. LXY-1 TaxID=3379133 RepID=UPI003EDEC92D